MTSTTTDMFVSLFKGRTDAYGTWEGGARRLPLTRKHYQQHLDGTCPIGVYPCVGLGEFTKVVWGCSDIDYKNTDDQWRLAAALEHVGLTAWVEETVRGFHVWLFSDGFVSAQVMRDCFLAAHQVVDVPPKEVNPKQTNLSAGDIGNYVRLPYPGGRTERRVCYEPDGFIPLEAFVTMATESLNSPDSLASVAAMYVAPPPPPVIHSAPEGLYAALAKLNTVGSIIVRDGVLEGNDRSSTLTHLAYECARSGISPDDAYLILEGFDTRCTQKYVVRKDGGRSELNALVLRAYGSAPSTSIPHPE